MLFARLRALLDYLDTRPYAGSCFSFAAAAGSDKTSIGEDLSPLRVAGLGHDDLATHHSDTILKNSTRKGARPCHNQRIGSLTEVRQGRPKNAGKWGKVAVENCPAETELERGLNSRTKSSSYPAPKAAGSLLLLPHAIVGQNSERKRARGNPSTSKEAE